MKHNADNHRFVAFLKNEKFIEWKLFPSKESDDYWEDFLKKNPDAREDFLLAEEHFNHIHFSPAAFPEEKKAEAIEQLERDVRAFYRKRKFRIYLYSTVASAAAMLLLFVALRLFNRKPQESVISDYIVGNLLEMEDIQLITNEGSSSFQQNVDIEISEHGVVQVTEKGKEQEKIAIDKPVWSKLIVPYGKRSTLTLSDGSKVWLNSGSVLEFPSQFSGKQREINLVSGEMYIEVTPERKKVFFVHTADFKVRVYGTAFNVSSYEDASQSVVLVEGSVGLQPSDGKDETYLYPGERAAYTGEGTFETQKVDVRKYVCWKEGYLLFDDTPMRDVLKQIERYYNLSFDIGKEVSFKDETCSGKIILSENLDNVLTAISLISNIRYKKENNQIFITPNL